MRIVGAGRTDRGVHAQGQVAAFHFPRPVALGGLVHGVNALLPPDIRILAAAEAPKGFHPQKSAVAKTYTYRFSTRNPLPPALGLTHLGVRETLDFERMALAALLLLGEHDFQAFAIQGGNPGTTRRRIYASRLERNGSEWTLRLTGSGFLRGMVRRIAGTLLEVGRRHRTLGAFQALFSPGSECAAAGPTAPSHGLCLEEVFYREDLGSLW